MEILKILFSSVSQPERARLQSRPVGIRPERIGRQAEHPPSPRRFGGTGQHARVLQPFLGPAVASERRRISRRLISLGMAASNQSCTASSRPAAPGVFAFARTPVRVCSHTVRLCSQRSSCKTCRSGDSERSRSCAKPSAIGGRRTSLEVRHFPAAAVAME